MYQKIKYFLKAAETGSFSLAAQNMYVSAQAITKQVSLLEKELGAKLFYRSSHGVELTEFGEYARSKLAHLDMEYEYILNDLKTVAKEEKKPLKVGIFSDLPRDELVSPVMSFLLANASDYQLHLEMIGLYEGQERIRTGSLDILLTNLHDEDDMTGFSCLSFSEFDAQVIVSLNHPWVIKDEITIQDLKSENFIKMNMGKDHYVVAYDHIFYNNIPCKKVIEANNFDTLMVLLRQASGFAVFPMQFVGMDRAQVKAFDYPGKSVKFYTTFVVREEDSTGRLKNLLEDLTDEFDLKEL